MRAAAARAGLDVLVLDRARSRATRSAPAGSRRRSSTSSSSTSRTTRRAACCSRSRGFRSAGIGGRAAALSALRRAVSYGIRRCEFDDYLLQRSGARLRARRAGDAHRRAIGGRLGRQRRDPRARSWSAPAVTSARSRAPGANLGKGERRSRRRRSSSRSTDDQAQHCGVEPDLPELYFCDDLKGYGWCFRKGNFLNVGLGREGNHRLVEHVHSFSRWLQSEGKVPADAPARFKGHAYLLYSHAKRPLVGEGVLIIGDAAGLAYAESGEGIRPAIESGLMAARIVANARGDYSKQRLSEYETQLAARFGARDNGASLASSLPESWKLALARSLMKTQWFTRNVVINRWFLHADTPALRA